MNDQRRYYPRRIGVVTPRSQSVYEFLVVGEDKPGTLAKTLSIFSEHYANFRDMSCYADMTSGDFVLNLFVDVARADKNAEEFRRLVSTLPFVTSVTMQKTASTLFDAFLFPATFAGDMRAAMLPADAIVGRELEVLQKFGDRGKEFAIELGRPLGIQLAETLRRFFPWSDADAMIGSAVDGLRALGWGLYSFDLSGLDDGLIGVSIVDPIFSGVFGVGESWFTVGLTSGLIEGLFGSKCAVEGKPEYTQEGRDFRFGLRQEEPIKVSKRANAS